MSDASDTLDPDARRSRKPARREAALPLGLKPPRPGSRTVRRDLYGQLRDAILEGRLAPGLQLPSTRSLAERLRVSRNSATWVYDLLVGEGYLESRTGAGTFVADSLRRPRPLAAAPSAASRRIQPAWRDALPAPPRYARPLPYDLRLGVPDVSQFPVDVWSRLSRRAARSLFRGPATYGDPAGLPALREAIAGHVSHSRAVACTAEDIIVTAGAQQAFDLLARVLVTPGRTTVAVERPGYPKLYRALGAAGARLHPTPVDAEGLAVDRLPPRAAVVCVTPSHQFPLGLAMTAQRRQDLLDFASRRNALVIEDDYDGEFRYGGRPLDALKTLDREERVFYVGTFSKSLFPSLRLGFIVAPRWAAAALSAARQLADSHGPLLSQQTLAWFIAEGHLARHIRRVGRLYGERRAALLDAVERHAEDVLRPVPASAGLHFSALLRRPVDPDAAAAKALAAGIGIEPLGRNAGCRPGECALAFGYGLLQAPRAAQAIARIATLLRTMDRTKPR